MENNMKKCTNKLKKKLQQNKNTRNNIKNRQLIAKYIGFLINRIYYL